MIFPAKALVRTRACEIERTSKDQKRERAKSVRTYPARTREGGVLAYLKVGFRGDLKSAGCQWRAFGLQLWSALHPDPSAKKAMQPVADVWRYTQALLNRIKTGRFVPPPAVAQARRDRARKERRKASAAIRREARRMAEVAAALARGEYPG